MKDAVQSAASFYESGVVYKLVKISQNSTEKQDNYIEPVFDLRVPNRKATFGPLKTDDQSVLFVQDDTSTRLFFQYSTEAVDFFDFVVDERDTQSMRSSIMDSQAMVETESVAGWKDNFGKGGFTEDTMDNMIDLSFQKYFYLDMDSQNETLDKQLNRWKQGLRWYNETTQRIQAETTPANLSYFKTNFGNSCCAFLVSQWNANMEKLNFEETLNFYSIISNILTLTSIFPPSTPTHTKISRLQQSILLSLQSLFTNNFAPIVKNILMEFWRKYNFEFMDNKIVSKSALDIMTVLSDIKDKTYSMDSSTSSRLIQQLSAEYPIHYPVYRT